MNESVFINISRIIERDSKTTTYKFALLRGVIELIQENSPFIQIESESATFPVGLLIEKWLLYYYPIIESRPPIPQINGPVKLAFEEPFLLLISAYSRTGGFSAFYNDLKTRGIPPAIQPVFIRLVKSLRNTITQMPMKYIGRSLTKEYYSIFSVHPKERGKTVTSIDRNYLVQSSGTFSIPLDYYLAFKTFGSFITGQDSLLFKWAEFSVNASGKTLEMEKVIQGVLKHPITERDITESKKIYSGILKKQGSIHCVWTGKLLSRFDIDHIIPFSVWKNNDLWNLLPSDPKTNSVKRDKIPSPALIKKQKDHILEYWNLISIHQPERFRKEIQISLLGPITELESLESGIERLCQSCEYLISKRGFEEWSV